MKSKPVEINTSGLTLRRMYRQEHWPKADTLWTLSDDKKLRRAYRKHVVKGRGTGYERWARVGRDLGRTGCGCQARWAILQVADRYVKIDRRKR